MSTSVRLATQQSDGQKVEIKTILKHDLLNRLQQQQFSINSNSTLQQQTQRRRRRQRISKCKGNDVLIKEWEALHMLKENPNMVDLIDVFKSNTGTETTTTTRNKYIKRVLIIGNNYGGC